MAKLKFQEPQTFRCKFCGTNYCKECGRGDFHGMMVDVTICRVCFQPKCQGERIGGTSRKAVGETTERRKNPAKKDSPKKQTSVTKRGKT